MTLPAHWLAPDWDAPQTGALMTTRHGGVGMAPFDTMNLRPGIGDDDATVRVNRERLRAAIGGAEPVWLNQVHGARVVQLTSADRQRDAMHDADASITLEPGLACTVQVADCLPVLFVAPHGVGGAHAGWRGLAGGVLEATAEALCHASGCEPAELQAWLGPCIGPRRFEVGADVLQAFGADPATADPQRFVARPAGREGDMPKWLANLPQLARDRLQRAGVTRVSGGSWCTVEDASRFFSFRRDRVTGRMVGAVWLRR